MIEADIIRGLDGRILMGHPPETQSDLSFREFIDRVGKSNKGIKLDFKDKTVVNECLQLLQKRDFPCPILLNADILIGPGADIVKFDSHTFVKQCTSLPNAILSVGWTTNPGSQTGYTQKMCDEMLDLVQNYPSHVTFPIRICYAQESWSALQSLVTENTSLSFWNNEPVSVEDKNWLETNADRTKCFYDILKM